MESAQQVLVNRHFLQPAVLWPTLSSRPPENACTDNRSCNNPKWRVFDWNNGCNGSLEGYTTFCRDARRAYHENGTHAVRPYVVIAPDLYLGYLRYLR